MRDVFEAKLFSILFNESWNVSFFLLSSESFWVNVCYDVISLPLLLLLFIRRSLFLVCGKFLINVTIVHNTVSLSVNVIESICARVYALCLLFRFQWNHFSKT